MSLLRSTQVSLENKLSYYHNWSFDQPLILGPQSCQDAERLQKVLHKVIQEFVGNFSKWEHFMPVSRRIREIIDLFGERPYEVGSYRTDFVFDRQGRMKLIEITCRFALNGLLEPHLYYTHAYHWAEKHAPHAKWDRTYEALYTHLEQKMHGSNKMCILKGRDVRNSSRLYVEIFEHFGLEVHEVQFTEILEKQELLNGAWIITELTLDEIESISDDALLFLRDQNLMNDFRTVLLVHDKEFFHALTQAELQEACLTANERKFFNRFLIPSHGYTPNDPIWEAAKTTKDHWILKPRALGKSERIYAGLVTSESEWQRIFEEENLAEFILQSWVPQRTWPGTLKGEQHEDYLTGTLIYVDNHNFGFGHFRASSHPVANVTDKRQVAVLMLQENEEDVSNLPCFAYINH